MLPFDACMVVVKVRRLAMTLLNVGYNGALVGRKHHIVGLWYVVVNPVAVELDMHAAKIEVVQVCAISVHLHAVDG